MRYRIRLALAASAAALLIGGAALADEVKIGALMPMTGDLQAYGETSLKGVMLAADEINAAGGVLGHKIDVSVGDTQTNPRAGVEAARKLANIENVVGIVGALRSGVSIPVAKSVSSAVGMTQISSASASPAITKLKDNDFLFRTVPSDAFQGVALAQVVKENGFGKVATLYIDNDYSEGLANSFAASFEALGGEISKSLAYEPGNASYRGELSKVAGNGGEALVLIGYPENGITILRQSLEEGYFDKFIFTDGMKAPEIIEAIGAEHLNGSIGTSPEAAADSDAAVRFRRAYAAKHGELPPKPFIDSAYDATILLGLAIEKAGSTDRKAVRDALRSVANAPGTEILPGEFAKAKELIADGKDIDYVGASGSQEIDGDGDVSGTFAYWTIDDGQIKTLRVFEPGS